jgi:hypothetical protein
MSTKAQFDAGFGITSTVFTAETVFNSGDICYLRSSVVGIGAADKDFIYEPFTVIGPVYRTNASGEFLDKNGVVAVGVTAADVATDGTTNDTADEWPNFYRIVSTKNPTNVLEKHETELLQIAGVNTLIDSEVWSNP